jgi:hypothetical protein
MDNEELCNVYHLENNPMRGSYQRKRKWVRYVVCMGQMIKVVKFLSSKIQ